MVIPAFNEEATIGEVVGRIANVMDVLVIDDASLDNTANEARASGAKVVSNVSNQGYANAINTGFQVADDLGYSYVFTVDADGEHDTSVLAECIEYLSKEGESVVLGDRSERVRFVETLASLYGRWRWGIKDIFCGFRGYPMCLWKHNGGFESSDTCGAELSVVAKNMNCNLFQPKVHGTRRAGPSRFDSAVKANFRLLRAIVNIEMRSY